MNVPVVRVASNGDTWSGVRTVGTTRRHDNGLVGVSFELRTELPAVPERAFDLSLDVEAHTGSMARSRERAVGGVKQGRLGLGDEVTWRARHFGVPWTMTSKITEWDRPNRFVDEQVAGPFAEFRHEHVFTATDRGETAMLDRVEFRAPLGALGRLVERVLLKRYLRQLIEARNAYLKTELSTSAAPTVSD